MKKKVTKQDVKRQIIRFGDVAFPVDIDGKKMKWWDAFYKQKLKEL